MVVRRIFRFFLKALATFVVLSVVSVIAYRWIPVKYTPLMFIRTIQQKADGRTVRCEHKWVPLEEMSPSMAKAVIASEDCRFLSHHGFDFVEIKNAVKEAEERGRHRGASTISQQTAKNVFLWPRSSWVRKGFEAYFTILIELFWGKERIMEVYLNCIETGDGLYGVEAVAQENFGCHASDLSERQCALIAATLPNPLRFDSAHPSHYIKQRVRHITKTMRQTPDFPPNV